MQEEQIGWIYARILFIANNRSHFLTLCSILYLIVNA